MSSSFANIKGTIEMQAVNGGRILEALKKIRNMANEVNNGSETIRNDSVIINKTVKNLQSVSEEVSGSVNTAQKASKQMAVSFSMAKKIVDGSIIIRPDQDQKG
jgi:methyl-accepting chemotaxis protein